MLIGHAAAGVALFLTGLILSAQSFRLDWQDRRGDLDRRYHSAAIGGSGRLHSAGPHRDRAGPAILLAAVPSGFFGILFAVNYRLDSATIGSMVIASTVFSIVTMAIAIAMLFPG